eukprot:345133-Pleurochrysis_carterae.AAC.4
MIADEIIFAIRSDPGCRRCEYDTTAARGRGMNASGLRSSQGDAQPSRSAVREYHPDIDSLYCLRRDIHSLSRAAVTYRVPEGSGVAFPTACA